MSRRCEKAYADGAFDALHARRRAEAEAGYAALRDEGEAGAAKADKRESDRDAQKRCSKRKKAAADALALDLTQLTEEGVALLGRLGCGPEKLRLGDDDAGEIIDTVRKDIREDKEALQKLIDDEADALVIKKKRNAISKKEGRARKKAKLEKDQERAKALPGRVAELEKQVCLLEFALDVM